jgi:hypothetical protein
MFIRARLASLSWPAEAEYPHSPVDAVVRSDEGTARFWRRKVRKTHFTGDPTTTVCAEALSRIDQELRVTLWRLLSDRWQRQMDRKKAASVTALDHPGVIADFEGCTAARLTAYRSEFPCGATKWRIQYGLPSRQGGWPRQASTATNRALGVGQIPKIFSNYRILFNKLTLFLISWRRGWLRR